jgi:5-(carboxyamino)imidazole ribonucleotide synthase
MSRATLGVLGGGQLGRMLGLAGHRLGLSLRFFDPSPDAVAGHVGELFVGEFSDTPRLERFAAGLEAVTYEFENVPVECARRLSRLVPVLPPPMALEQSQDRLHEKNLFTRLGIPVPAYRNVESRVDLDRALAEVGLPAVLKTRRMGYDGKGQAVLRSRDDADPAWARLGPSVPLILERFVAFERELSILAVRSTRGETAFYPLVENEHREGILRVSRAPADGGRLGDAAREAAAALLAAMDYAGVLALEFFDVGGSLLANEMAPRVHNSGHWTIDGAATSQFENHLRAILGLPLGDTSPLGHAAMINLIGAHPPLAKLAAIPGARVHLYAKEPRPGRKLGHVTFMEASRAALDARLEHARCVLGP